MRGLTVHERIVGGFQILWDGKTVWINDSRGISRARYSGLSQAIDVHTDFETQQSGRTCLACGPGDWPAFVREVHTHLGLTVPDAAKPTVRPLPTRGPVTRAEDTWGPKDYASVLERAADRVERGWCQGVFGDRQGNVCVYGAVGVECGREIDKSDGSYFVDSHRPTNAAADLAHARMKAAIAYLAMPRPDLWNDEPGRTQAEVVQALRDAAHRARKEAFEEQQDA